MYLKQEYPPFYGKIHAVYVLFIVYVSIEDRIKTIKKEKKRHLVKKSSIYKHKLNNVEFPIIRIEDKVEKFFDLKNDFNLSIPKKKKYQQQ